MPRALSVDLRERVLAAVEAGSSCRQAGERFGVGIATAIRWQARFRAEGVVAAKPMGGDQRSGRIEAHAEVILQACEAQPQAYLRELRDSLREKGVTTSTSGLYRFFARHGISRKKGICTPPSKAVPDVMKAREDWFESQLDLDPERIIFLDETAAATNMARR